MRAFETSAEMVTTRRSVRDRILGDTYGSRDEALVFAASSIIKEITAARYNGAIVERQITTDRGAYTLQGSQVHGPDGVHPVVIVFAEPPANLVRPAVPAVPSADAIRIRFNLTRKESRVAELLATQMTNEQIADVLCISTHTARHHTQSVLSKLSVRSRRDVAAVLSRGHS